ncbi:MAG: hypothetical protein IJD28_02310 [Deferribacterales bacterium]|nr:hypothetical protein [Deferribacterales bacterium]
MSENHWKERFKARYKPLLKDGYDAFEGAMSAPKARHIRIAQCRSVNYLPEISECAAVTPVEGYKGVFKVADGEDIVSSLSFQTGGAYIMNPSSVVPAQILAELVGDNPFILDVSAAPGGKTCAISDFVGRKGFIVANEMSSSRLKSLNFNLEKYGCGNVKTISADGRLLSKFFKNTFDGILLDAPCSNENKIFRNKTVQAQWSPELVERMAALQRQLLASAFDCLVEGGVLVYSTCTLSLEENELAVKYLLDTAPDAELIPSPYFAGGGLSGYSSIDEKVARIMPHIYSVDGFFVAVIAKKGVLKQRQEQKPQKLTSLQKDFFKNYFNTVPSWLLVTDDGKNGYWEVCPQEFSKVPFKRKGLSLYKHAGNKAELTSQGAWEFSQYIRHDEKTFISKNDAQNYLKGFDLPLMAEYKGRALFYNGIAIGTTKVAHNVLKNKLDRYFLYGKNIEW